MKQISILTMMLALVMGMSQCKKDEVQPTSNENDSRTITLDVNREGSRVDVNPSTGLVNFETGDQIHVASGGKYVGTLTYNGTVFTGAIANAVEGSPLQFYFLGNVTPAETLTSGITETCSVVISNQTTSLPVISAAPSNENYTASNDSYTARLLNKCALVKFNVTTSSSAATCIAGMNNKMTVSFSDNTLTPSKEGDGVISVATGNGERWAILLPQAALEEGTSGSAYSGSYTGTRGAVPAINENGYLTVGIPVFIVPGAISGQYTINDNGDKVVFSQGNLRYQASTNTWQFAEHQYDYVGNDNINISSTYSGWIDMFCWGTSGFNHGAVCYQPWSTSNDNSDYYAYGNEQYNLYDQSGQADWGYNAISNGGNHTNQWRTLTGSEWSYVFDNRSGNRYAMAVVNGVNGIILLPDNWDPTVHMLNNINTHADYTNNVITAVDWSAMESNGAVFLPAAGYREYGEIYYVGNVGEYWSSSCDSFGGLSVYFTNRSISPDFPEYSSLGLSVRLVHTVY